MKKDGQKDTASKGSATKNMRKRIQCPKCKSRIIDSSLSTVTEIRILSDKEEPLADFYLKCNICNSELAIKKLR